MKKLIIVRGLPATGKSYISNEIAKINDKSVILSTDEFWYKIRKPHLPEEYSFNPVYLEQAHKWNQKRAHRHIELGSPCIIIDNTNTTTKEFCCCYAKYALFQDYKIEIQEPTSSQWKEISILLKDKETNRDELKLWAQKLEKMSVGVHNVPAYAIEKMIWRWENDIDINLVMENCLQKHT